MNHYNNGKTVYTVGDIERMEAEILALRAQVEELREAALKPKGQHWRSWLDNVKHIILKMPAQCLAEVRARAVESVNNQELYMIIKTSGSKACAYEVQEWLEVKANQIRQQSQEQSE